jgi:hypothetical protein
MKPDPVHDRPSRVHLVGGGVEEYAHVEVKDNRSLYCLTKDGRICHKNAGTWKEVERLDGIEESVQKATMAREGEAQP